MAGSDLVAVSDERSDERTFMAIGAAGYLLGAVLTVLCVPASPR